MALRYLYGIDQFTGAMHDWPQIILSCGFLIKIMAITTQNPANGETLKTFLALDNTQIDTILQRVCKANIGWAATSIADRSACLLRAGQ